VFENRKSASVADASLRCWDVIPTARRKSSREIGWTSLLLDVHSGVASSEPYTSIPTPDPRVGVTLSGRYSADFYTRGHWRHDAHAPGSINVHRTGDLTRYRFPTPEDPDYRMALLYYPIAQLEAATDQLRRIGQRSVVPIFASVVERDPAITSMTFALVNAMASGESDFYAETVAAWLAVHMLTRYSDVASEDDERSPGLLSDARLDRVIEFMSAHLGEPLTLEQLATEACISKFHFSRIFRTKVGKSPHRFLADLRLDAARRRLAATDLPIAQVAGACGFPSSSHFSAAFLSRYGVTPSEYRAKRRVGENGHD
jgi:AraC family transcriptional regulator